MAPSTHLLELYWITKIRVIMLIHSQGLNYSEVMLNLIVVLDGPAFLIPSLAHLLLMKMVCVSKW